ncbi:uncharacterized protein LOC133190627 [Saccostrea echinata]|uniref:uncharacterized protein LOC133190627 n=1 Tax=Saccostrea echinata TaxID=191078 RepID=UPI002A81906D|nr:uncharacterized protein LOC133190627 [Saccostrea echinata]
MADALEIACLCEDDDVLLMSTVTEDDVKSQQLNLDNLSEEEFYSFFRFQKNDISRLCEALSLPSKFVCPNGTRVSTTEGVLILLRRLSYPNRLDDMKPLFNRSKSELSYISNTVLDYLYHRHSGKFCDLNQSWLDEEHLRMYADAISDIGGPLPNCWGFIDGTVRPICRPSANQNLVYSGHKRVHGLKFQSVVIPNGLIANMYGPIEAKRHDSAMLRMSELMPKLEQRMTMNDGTVFSLYGDLAYPLRVHLITPFKGAVLSNQERIFNCRMSKLRSSVEWTFGKILSLFAFVDYKKNQKLFLQPVAKYYLVASLLTNCHTCLYGSVTSEYFNLPPPTLEEYMS